MTWTPPPALVEKVALAIGDVQLLTGGTFREMMERTPYARADYSIPRLLIDVARAALTASGLGDAVELLQRVAKIGSWVGDHRLSDSDVIDCCVDVCAEARALLASLDATEGTKP